jgi:ATP synthase F1 delta subunit
MNIDQQIGHVIEKKGNELKAEIVSSYELDAAEKAKLLNVLPSLKQVKLNYRVEKDIIAGLIIYVGSLVIDLSLKNQLRDFYNSLYENI